MKCKGIILAVLLFFVLSVSERAFAGNSMNRMVVAYSAFQQLTLAEQNRVTALLKLNPSYGKWVSYLPDGISDADRNQYLFLMAATWTDELEAAEAGTGVVATMPVGEDPTLNAGYSDTKAHSYWHYNVTSFSYDGTRLLPVSSVNAAKKIAVFRTGLASTEPDALKSYDLVWLVSLLTDVHQPLHCATRVFKKQPTGDEEGRLVLVSGIGPYRNLYDVWENALGEGAARDFMKAVTIGQAMTQRDLGDGAYGTGDEWASNSFDLARNRVYVDDVGTGPGPFKLSSSYQAKVQRITQDQFALAGVRLANIIKKSLRCGFQSCDN